MRLLVLNRLLDADPSKFKIFYDTPPDYAILSHTWDDEELTLQDIQSSNPLLSSKKGIEKLVDFARLALTDGYEYGWIDTCCIDKTNLTELSEAINSMFRWYENAAQCYVYLADVPDVSVSSSGRYATALAGCKWFTRGWTLQELIAPRNVVFYTQNWVRIADKHKLARTIAQLTQIEEELLTGMHPVLTFSIGERMSWAAGRNTTRPEDIAYSLLGIFAVNLPLLYGEGAVNAFTRLQEEIVRKSDDHTILAWENCGTRTGTVFAPYPMCFPRGPKSLQRNLDANFSYTRIPFAMTNKGLQIRLPLIRPDLDSKLVFAVLDCHTNSSLCIPRCIPLRMASDGDNKFSRAPSAPINLDRLEGFSCAVRDIFIVPYAPVLETQHVGLVRILGNRWTTLDLLEASERQSTEQTDGTAPISQQQRNVIGTEIWLRIQAVLVPGLFIHLAMLDTDMTWPVIFWLLGPWIIMVRVCIEACRQCERLLFVLRRCLSFDLVTPLVEAADSILAWQLRESREAQREAFGVRLIRCLKAYLLEWKPEIRSGQWSERRSSLVFRLLDEGRITRSRPTMPDIPMFWTVLFCLIAAYVCY